MANSDSFWSINNSYSTIPDFNQLLLDEGNQKAKAPSFEQDFFGEFKLFGSSLTGGTHQHLPKQQHCSATASNKDEDRKALVDSSKPWNSVLLNDIDSFSSIVSASSLINQIDSGNNIKSLWPNNLDDSFNGGQKEN